MMKMRNISKSGKMPDFAFRMMSLIHDNPLLWIFKEPYKSLKAAGLKPGQKVLDIGCAPGLV